MTAAIPVRLLPFVITVLLAGVLRLPAQSNDELLLEASLNGEAEEVERLLDAGANPNAFRPDDNWTPLMLAAMNGSTQVVRILLDHEADPNLGNDEDGTALCAAAAAYIEPAGEPDEIVGLLLEHGADLKGMNGSGMNALMYAAREGKVAVIERLLEAGADVNYEDVRQWTALLLAVANDQNDAARVLLDAGARPDVRGEFSQWTILSMAAQNNNPGLVFMLLEAGADPNGLPPGSDYFAPPLWWAANNDNLEIAEALLAANAMPNYSDGGYYTEDGTPRTPLDWAKEHGNSAIETLLREAGAVDDLQSVYNEMLDAVRGDDAERFRKLMENRVDPRRLVYGDEEEVTLLNEAAQRGNAEIVEAILSFAYPPNSYELYAAHETATDNGFDEIGDRILRFAPGEMLIQSIDSWRPDLMSRILEIAPEAVNYTADNGLKPLHMATEIGDIQMSEMLLAAGADVNAEDRWGESPLFACARLGTTEIGEMFMEWGADVEHRSRNGMTPLHAAVLASQDEMIEWLLEKGATLWATDRSGWNALHYAAFGGSRSTVLLLLDLGLDPGSRTDQQETPLDIARRILNYEATEVLEEVSGG